MDKLARWSVTQLPLWWIWFKCTSSSWWRSWLHHSIKLRYHRLGEVSRVSHRYIRRVSRPTIRWRMSFTHATWRPCCRARNSVSPTDHWLSRVENPWVHLSMMISEGLTPPIAPSWCFKRPSILRACQPKGRGSHPQPMCFNILSIHISLILKKRPRKYLS